MLIRKETQPVTVGYVRASTDKQENSHEVQIEAMRKWYHPRRELLPTWAGIFSDRHSAKAPLFTRPGGQNMRDYLREGDHVICTKMDRMFRSTRDMLECADIFETMGVTVHLLNNGAEIVFDKSNPYDKLQRTLLAAFAEFERDLISSRTKEALAYRRSQGMRSGNNCPPYGYKWEIRPDGNGKRRRFAILDEVELAQIDGIVSAHDEGMSQRQIVTHLWVNKVKRQCGAEWRKAAISEVIKMANNGEFAGLISCRPGLPKILPSASLEDFNPGENNLTGLFHGRAVMTTATVAKKLLPAPTAQQSEYTPSDEAPF